MAYKYKYTDASGKPLAECPECGQDLTAENGIDLGLSCGGNTSTVPSRLDESGVLQDTDDRAVARGNHSGTYCGGCSNLLIDMEDVDEDSVE